MQVFFTFVALFLGVAACFLIGFFAGRAFERSRIRAPAGRTPTPIRPAGNATYCHQVTQPAGQALDGWGCPVLRAPSRWH